MERRWGFLYGDTQEVDFRSSEGSGTGVPVVGGAGGRVGTTTFSSELRRFFKMREFLGSGGFGEVYRAVERSSGQEVAVKCQLLEFYWEEIENEIEALRNLEDHVNVLRLHEVIRGQAENEYVYFVLDLMSLSLEDAVERMSSEGLHFGEGELKSLWLQCLRGLRHIHRSGYLHLDLTRRNVLLDKKGGVKICDFGMAQRREISGATPQYDLGKLSLVFIFSVTQEERSDLGDLVGKVSSPAMQLVEELYYGRTTARKALKARFFRIEPCPEPPQIAHIVSLKSAE